MSKYKFSQKTISELLDMNFFIPSYQRGYRWTEQQVEDLLNDIWGFIKKTGKKDNEWYCLQPIVVKTKNNSYEVLDGQQRLTTIFLLLKHLEKFIESERKTFEIEYKTRNSEKSNSKDFLINISTKTEKNAGENIDYFFIHGAYLKIINWFKQKANEGHKSISSKFITPFLEDTKVIWYEVPFEKDSVDIFTRINMGKIPLTNAELIKALFLNSSNFKHSDPKKFDPNEIELKQLEIASEWDRIEYSLQNEDFWYFINKDENSLPTRIEFIFNLMEDIANKKNEKDQYSTFRFFSDKFKFNNVKEIKKNWKEIKKLFQILEEWFENRELYHKVGYLISVGVDIKDLITDSMNKTKTEFKSYLNELILEKIKCENIDHLEYGDGLIKNILLLHNIQTMLKNENEFSRFPFDRYKKENWDIEHIHAIATEMPSRKQHRNDWLDNSKEFIDNKNLNKEITDFVKNYDENIKADDSSFDKLADKILIYFSKKSNNKPYEDENLISNLVLLDSGTNRGYRNAVFPAKRKKIIERDKKGTFIPICTKNVFLKYYSKDVSQMTFWEEYDRNSYLEDIKATIFPSQTANKEL